MNQNEFARSETSRNLMRAFAGESEARNRYTIAGEQAGEREEYLLSRLFAFTAAQEKEHAVLLWARMAELSGETIHIDAGFPVETARDTKTQLQAAVHNELEEAQIVYPDFEKTTRAEGFLQEAELFNKLIVAETIHAARFARFLDLMEQQKLFSGGVKGWICLNCGFVYEGESAPLSCPLCSHPQGYFVRRSFEPFAE